TITPDSRRQQMEALGGRVVVALKIRDLGLGQRQYPRSRTRPVDTLLKGQILACSRQQAVPGAALFMDLAREAGIRGKIEIEARQAIEAQQAIRPPRTHGLFEALRKVAHAHMIAEAFDRQLPDLQTLGFRTL